MLVARLDGYYNCKSRKTDFVTAWESVRSAVHRLQDCDGIGKTSGNFQQLTGDFDGVDPQGGARQRCVICCRAHPSWPPVRRHIRFGLNHVDLICIDRMTEFLLDRGCNFRRLRVRLIFKDEPNRQALVFLRVRSFRF